MARLQQENYERSVIDKLAAIDPSYPELIKSPVRCPLFRRTGAGWVPDWSTMPD